MNPLFRFLKSNMNICLFFMVAIFWSGSFIGIKAAVTDWPPLFSAATRVTIALLALLAFKLICRKKTTIHFNMRWRIWVIGIFSQAIPFSFLFWGECTISAGLAGILNATVPIWTFILSILFLPQFQFYSFRKLIGLLIGLSGVITIFYPLITIDHSNTTLLSAGAIILMTLSYAIGGLLNQYYLSGDHKIDFFTNLYHQHWGSAIALALLTIGFHQIPTIEQLTHSITPWVASLYLGICSTAIAYFIFYHLIKSWDALRASTILYVVPILTIVWDYFIYNTTPTIHELAGVFIILFGVLLIQLTRFKIPSLLKK